MMNRDKPGFISKNSIYLPLLTVILDLLMHRMLPDKQSGIKSPYYFILLSTLTVIYLLVLVLSYRHKSIKLKITYSAPLIAAAFIIVGIWDLVTLKLNLFHLPYFPGPERVLTTLVIDWRTLLISTLYSMKLLFTGYLMGVVVGLVTGIYIGWSQRGNYWIGPVIKIIGPIPATAWIPIAMVVFPTSFWASVFLITLAVWFPVTVMTGSGIANVQKSYFEVARTLGATRKYLIFKVALPASSPTIFVGLFMGLGAAFLTLIAAEMLGVKAGLGWYITWAQGWAEYSKVYASLIVIALLFFGIITLLFKIKDHFLVWQKGLLKW
jgi:NitT/TauT family transport system permease protein